MAALYEVKQIIVDLMAAFPEWKPAHLDKTIEQYADALKGYKLETITHAANVCRDVCLFFPKIAEIKKAINESHAVEVQAENAEWKCKEWVPISPKIQKYLDDFRQHMVNKGMWKERRKPTVLQ